MYPGLSDSAGAAYCGLIDAVLLGVVLGLTDLFLEGVLFGLALLLLGFFALIWPTCAEDIPEKKGDATIGMGRCEGCCCVAYCVCGDGDGDMGRPCGETEVLDTIAPEIYALPFLIVAGSSLLGICWRCCGMYAPCKAAFCPACCGGV
jgi:hypothetical protein